MTHNERWLVRCSEVINFKESNKRRPSKYNPEERNAWNWLRHTQKLMGAGELKPERVELFKKLLDLANKYKHKNQYE